ncbi:MAG: YfhO family protein, partial [Candidatus Cloacimonetes bacterium]|nr:YfhO family protein [Candidatus Cloacimonadota bacterium]
SAFFGSVSFLFIVHWGTLLLIGHLAKFRPIMMIPLTLYFFFSIFEKASLLNLVSLSFMIALMVRTRHYQIVFYVMILLTFVGIYLIYKNYSEKKKLSMSLLFIFLAILLAVGVVLQPLSSIKEFTPYSIRGGSSDESSEGLEFDYATSWSLHPAEIMDFFIPRFWGGASSEVYNLSNPDFAHLKNRQIPGYWGHMPFTEATNYLGIVILFFVFVGLIMNWRNGFIRTLFFLIIFSLLLSFGKHLPWFYNIFFNYVPAFNKFRVPVMIVVLIHTLLVIISAYGLNSILTNSGEKLLRATIISVAILGIVAMIAFGVSGTLSYTTATDISRYESEVLEVIKTIRKDFLIADTERMILLTLLVFGATFAFLKKIIKNRYIFVCFILILTIFDLVQIQKRFLLEKVHGKYEKLYNPNNWEKNHFVKTPIDDFLLKQKNDKLELAEFRIFPVVQNLWATNDYSYYHQSIGGYDGAKLRIVQDLMDYGRVDNMGVFSRNIPDMLNARYFLIDATVPDNTYPFQNLELKFKDKKTNVYENMQACGRAWFVGDYVVGKSIGERFSYLNDQLFDIRKTAILESEPSFEISEPVNAEVKIAKLNPNEILLEVVNESNSLLILSEIYYPEGWKAFVDGNETEIIKTNHVLRSIYVPSGKHNVKMVFDPPSIHNTKMVSVICTFLSFFLLVIAIIIEVLKKKKIGQGEENAIIS